MTIDLFGGLVPMVQVLLVLGIFAVIFLIAFNPLAAANLMSFLRDFYKFRQLQGKSVEFESDSSERVVELHIIKKIERESKDTGKSADGSKVSR